MSKRKSSGRGGGRVQERRGHPERAENERSTRANNWPSSAGGDIWLFGHHAVEAALRNGDRVCRRLLATSAATESLGPILQRSPHAGLRTERASREDIDRHLPPGAVHQGVALLVAPLPDRFIEDVIRDANQREQVTLCIVDQGTDPRNVGAVLRSAAAFSVSAVIVQDRHAPDATGVLAKAASGALETVPMVRATNLARTLDQLKQAGFWSIGLDGDGDQSIAELDWPPKRVIVLGAEGKGLRRLVREHCDFLCRIPMTPRMESLNLSNAAAIAFYESFKA